jgi:hypothetical protein
LGRVGIEIHIQGVLMKQKDASDATVKKHDNMGLKHRLMSKVHKRRSLIVTSPKRQEMPILLLFGAKEAM